MSLAWQAAVLLGLLAIGVDPAAAEDRALKLYNIHTQEKAVIVFKRDGRYDQAGLQKLNQFLRDWREEKPTRMDPQLFDLLWDVYRQSGSRDYIDVVCGYRSSETNSMLRRRSKGVAQNSLHMKGQAIDFYIPDVELAKLRAIGLKMQLGGVGFYPSSGAPFVHLDTGSVRHWPRMSHQQLVQLFPDGRTLHIPSDGKPLPGYAEALAAYKARKTSGGVAVASFAAPAPSTGPMVIAAVDPEEEEDEIAVAMPTPSPRRAVAVASYAAAAVPFPRLAPRGAEPVVVAAVALAASVPAPDLDFDTVATVATAAPAAGPDFDLASPQDWQSLPVPRALVLAMAARDLGRRGASVPLAPPAVVAPVDVSRPLRAAAITTAVLRTADGAAGDVPEILAYAPIESFAPSPPPKFGAAGIRLPQPNPLRTVAVARPPATRSIVPPRRFEVPDLTMTVLDTEGLRLWMGVDSTRQKRYALLTMPDLSQSPGLADKPELAFAAGFGPAAYGSLRTDRFAGPLVVQPFVVDLTPGLKVAAR
ncbi:MAG: DUF882 domain-containing protein [Bauldia sp.]